MTTPCASFRNCVKLHPRNRLVLLETGSTALRAGRPEQAEAVLTEGLGMLAATTGPRIPGEEALWRYKRGAARVALGRIDAAPGRPGERDLARTRRRGFGAARAWSSRAWRCSVAIAARPPAKRGRRRRLCQQGQDPVCLDEAKKLLRTSDGR